MSARYYRLLPAFAASLSLLLAGCGSDPPDRPTAATAPTAQPGAAQVAASQPEDIDTESTIWTVLGMAKRPSQRSVGPQTGDKVSPILWEAAHDALSFVKITSEDPLMGVVQSDWYSPPGKPDERMRISVFILSRALRSDSLSVTIDRQQRSSSGQWTDAPIARDAVAELENAVLLRARHIRAERYRETL
ncbi:MAG: DUF3576 domain-containing protein [Alphaproteobacteria bacterium]|nr:DUF3576 domain-containing protein [Alphaproteobacteria bacterium]MBV9583963.1 DUF3576 domain-containing protein [Alphaproteobacteria bacterium]